MFVKYLHKNNSMCLMAVTDVCTSHYILLIQFIYSTITSRRVLDGELLHAKILEANLFAFAYRLFHEDLSSIDAPLHASIEEKSS